MQPQNRADKLTAHLQENRILPPADKGVKGFIGTQNKRLRIEFPNGEAAVPEKSGGYLYWNR